MQSTQGTKQKRKEVVNERVNQAIEAMIIKMPYLSKELNALKTSLAHAIK